MNGTEPPATQPPCVLLRRLRMRASTPAGALLLLLAAAGFGCSGWRKTAWEAGFGSFATDLHVTSVATRGDYLDATLVGHGLNINVFTPKSEPCARVLESEALVSYVERGIAGRLEREGVRCDAIGIGPPLVQRARQPRGQSLSATPIPRSQATFRRVYDDDELILVRGRFPLAFHVGWSGGEDSVAALPNDPVCRAAVEGGVASMEYRPMGRTALSLLGAHSPCPIVGLILPLGPATAPPDGPRP